MPSFGFFGGFSGGGGGTALAIPDPAGEAFGPLAGTVERLFDGHQLEIQAQTGFARETIQFWVPMEEWESTANQVVGVPATYSSAWGGSVVRRLPMAHPYRTGMYATGATIVGRGRTSSTSLYSSYLFRITFETVGWTPSGDTPFLSIRRAFSSGVVTVPGRFLRCATDGIVLQHDAGIPIPQVAYLVTMFGVSAANVAAIAAASAAPVNAATLYLPGLTAAPGYALFQGIEDQNDFSYFGFTVKSITYRFLVRDRLPFDQIIHPVTGVNTAVLLPDGSNHVLRSDLNLLFLD